MFVPDKPHRYGSNVFMTCDSPTAYCHRFEMYACKRESGASDAKFDHKTGGSLDQASQHTAWHVHVFPAPTMVAFHWWDWKSVHYLCTGSVMSESSIGRKVKRVGALTVPGAGDGLPALNGRR
ncbi:hypothetical protein PR001_g6026 [Phytophthora rubi]|uniref:Uncharacterized protein n=1 Tax=Phytophthora rubi TaxID=129364 RepID=A0A6A3NKN9_9STRA|nr:hypothetical protein PR001_g6026 [Phytophthora rubi]